MKQKTFICRCGNELLYRGQILYRDNKGHFTSQPPRSLRNLNITLGVVLAFLLGVFVGSFLAQALYIPSQTVIINPTAPREVVKPKITTQEEPAVQMWQGIASYYSRSGCVGCSKNFTMANGKPLNDNELTVAFNKLPLGWKVRITNNKTGDKVIAMVTDRGGFERLDRIVDLTLGTKKAINCSDLCDVTIEELSKL